MVVGVATIDLHLHGVQSLKEKRGIVRRIVERTRNRYPVSVAEVAQQDAHQQATIGFAVVSGSSQVADSILNKVLAHVEDLHLAEVTHFEFELIHF